VADRSGQPGLKLRMKPAECKLHKICPPFEIMV